MSLKNKEKVLGLKFPFLKWQFSLLTHKQRKLAAKVARHHQPSTKLKQW